MFLAFPFSIINIAYLVAGYKQKMKKTALIIKTVLMEKQCVQQWRRVELFHISYPHV